MRLTPCLLQGFILRFADIAVEKVGYRDAGRPPLELLLGIDEGCAS